MLKVLGSNDYRAASARIGAEIAASVGLDGLESVIAGLVAARTNASAGDVS